MKKILNIVTSVKGETSYSRKLSKEILEKLVLIYPGSIVHTHDLTEEPLPHLDENHVTAFYTQTENRTKTDIEVIKHSDEAIREIMDADIIVIGVPYYNFNIPSTLKAWIDHIVRVGQTFKYENGKPAGFITGKKVFLALASGALYSDDAMKSLDYVEPYLKTILGFIGMTDITTFRIEGTMIPVIKDTSWDKALGQVNEFAF